jgi:hypothetical protein
MREACNVDKRYEIAKIALLTGILVLQLLSFTSSRNEVDVRLASVSPTVYLEGFRVTLNGPQQLFDSPLPVCIVDNSFSTAECTNVVVPGS